MLLNVGNCAIQIRKLFLEALFILFVFSTFISVCEVNNCVRQWEVSVTCDEMGRLFLAENSHIPKGEPHINKLMTYVF